MAEETVLIRFKSEDDVTKTTKTINDDLASVGTNAGKAGSAFSGMGTMMTGVLQGVGQALGGFAMQMGSKALGAVTDFVSGSIAEASQWNSVYAQTQAVVKSTGEAAGLTAEQMGEMASSMSASAGQSLFSDDAILGAQNVLATFTNIKGQNFGMATQSILDMSQALGMDLDSAAMQVGKALNDPVAGLAALSRSGVQFTAEQEAMIKAMVEAGNVAGAQEVMMKELNTQFGGSAAAAVDTYAGQQVILQEKFADVQQTLGTALMPILMEFGTFMSDTVVPIIADVVGSLSGWINSMQMTGTTSGVFDTIRNAIAGVPGVLNQMGQGLATVGTFLQPLTDAFMNWVGVVVPAIVSAGTAIAEYLGSPTVQGYLSSLQTAFTALATLIMDVLVLAFNTSAIAWTYLSDAFTIAWPYIKTVLDTFYSLATIVMGAVTGILTALSQVVKGDFSGAFETMKKTVGTALTDLWGFFKTLDKNLLTFFTEIKPEVLKLGTDMVQGIADGIKSGASWIKDALLAAAREAWSAVTSFFTGQGSSGGDGGEGDSGGPQSRSMGAGGSSANTNGVVYNLSLHASYGSSQSASSLISDARAWMMTLGAE
jgi:phage-related protein